MRTKTIRVRIYKSKNHARNAFYDLKPYAYGYCVIKSTQLREFKKTLPPDNRRPACDGTSLLQYQK